jgi:hypothetical protein
MHQLSQFAKKKKASGFFTRAVSSQDLVSHNAKNIGKEISGLQSVRFFYSL